MRQYECTVLEEGQYKSDRLYTGEVARLKSYVTQRPPFDVKNPYMATIAVNRNLHSDDSDRLCMHIELDISESRYTHDLNTGLILSKNCVLIKRLLNTKRKFLKVYKYLTQTFWNIWILVWYWTEYRTNSKVFRSKGPFDYQTLNDPVVWQ